MTAADAPARAAAPAPGTGPAARPGAEDRPVSWPLAVACAAVAVLVLAAITATELRVHGRPALWSLGSGLGVDEETGFTTGAIGLAMTLLATVVLRAGARTMGWLLGASGLFWAVDGLSESYVRLGVVSDHALPLMTAAVWFLMRFTSLLPATIVLLPLVFPTGRFLPGRWRAASWAAVAAMVLSAAAYVVVPWLTRYDASRLPPGVDLDPTTIPALAPVAGGLTGALQLATVLGIVVPVGVVATRYRRSTGTGRDQMRWLLWGAVVTVALILLSLVVDVGSLGGLVLFLDIVVVPAAVTVAVVNPAVVPIEDLLGRTLVVAGTAVVLVALDLAVVAGLAAVLGDSLEQRQVVVVVLLLTILLYGPLRGRLSRSVRRLVLGDRADPYDVVAGLASTLETTAEGPEQLAAVARAVAAAFGVRFVAVEVERGSGERITATHGGRPAATRTLPITYRGTEVGRIVLPARGVRSRLSRRDEQLLGDLVRQAATAARTSRLAEELQDSRERLVTAREEERRRIRRDLHDGLGPALSGVVFELEAARLLVDRDGEAARARLAGVTQHVQEVVADVRRLVHDLRPPALDDRGLVGALRQQAERLDPAATVTAAELGPLPAAVEVAAYRIASEALANVARHARATRCEVTLGIDAGDTGAALLVEVRDDGTGVPPGAEAGVGLVGLRERAAELGGRSEVTCPPEGGTVVRAWLPLRGLERSTR